MPTPRACVLTPPTIAIHAGDRPTDYLTSLIGNRTLAWLSNVTADGNTDPWVAYVAVHAPHLPATPAPWYASAPVPGVQAPRTPNWNTAWQVGWRGDTGGGAERHFISHSPPAIVCAGQALPGERQRNRGRATPDLHQESTTRAPTPRRSTTVSTSPCPQPSSRVRTTCGLPVCAR